MFFKSLGVKLYKTYANNWKYLWQDFNDTITVIVCSTIDNCVVDILPEMVFGAFGLFISLDEMRLPSFVERLKKESKHYLPILDAILEASISQFLGFSNCLLSIENVNILHRLNDFSSQCGSLFCCMIVGQRISAGTDGWWDLHIVDRQLLLFLLQTSCSLQNDIAVYLPKKSPNVRIYYCYYYYIETNRIIAIFLTVL